MVRHFSRLSLCCGVLWAPLGARAEGPGSFTLSPDGTVLRFFESRGTWLPLGRGFQKLVEGGGRLFAIYETQDIYELNLVRSRSLDGPPSGLELL